MPKRHTILVVDDEPDVVQSVRDLLRLDYKVLTATKADEACELLKEHQVDVVMTDQRMPEITGVQFLNKIKDPYPEATRLLFTGYADIRAVIDAINQGNVYRYIAKPWDPDELQTIIREACDRHDLIVQHRLLTDDLEHANTDLKKVNDQLAESDRLKTAFIHVASHELRTPLTILNGYAQLAAGMHPTDPVSGFIEKILQSGKRLTELVNQIIGMLEHGDFQSKLQAAPVELDAYVKSIADLLQPFVDLRKQTFVKNISPNLGTIVADGPNLRDSINQLLLNAIKFTPDGGTITLTAQRTEDNSVQFIVSDTGCGMDEKTLQHFGSAFFTQMDVSHHSSGTHEFDCRGIGLGVNLVTKIAEMHGGRLEAKSTVGQGTTVTLTIPAAMPMN